MVHIELLNEDVQLATTFTMQLCCDACNADGGGGGGGCGCDTYVCGVGNVTCTTCNIACNGCNVEPCYSCNY